MAGPVETDALRDKAVWLGHLDCEFGEQVATAADEVDRLRAVIENAPHGSDSEGRQCELLWREGFRRDDRCTCWKADARG